MRRVLLALLALSASAYAVPITFTLRGTASGSVNGVPFTGASFTITYSSDTDIIPAVHTFIAFPPRIASISIAGVGNGTLSNAFQLTTFTGIAYVELYDVYGNTGGLSFIGSELYSPTSTFGPVSVQLSPISALLHNSPSSFGNITFTNVPLDLTFGAVTPTIPSATPIPSTLILVLTGLAGAGLIFRHHIKEPRIKRFSHPSQH